MMFAFHKKAFICMLLIGNGILHGAAEGDITEKNWDVAAQQNPQLFSLPFQLLFNNNTNVPVEVTYKIVAEPAQKIDVPAEQTRDFADAGTPLFSVIAITVSQGILPGGKNAYGTQTFNIADIIRELRETTPLSRGQTVTLSLERQPGYFGIPSFTTFKLSASAAAGIGGAASAASSSSSLAFQEHLNAMKDKMGDLVHADFLFYNGALTSSVALEYYQNNEHRKIIVPAGTTVFLGRNLGSDIIAKNVSIFGGEESLVPMLAQYYSLHESDIADLIKNAGGGAHRLYQINVPPLSLTDIVRKWNVYITEPEAVPEDAISAAELEKTAQAEAQSHIEKHTPLSLYGAVDRFKIQAFAQETYINKKPDQTGVDSWNRFTNELNEFALDHAPTDRKDEIEQDIETLKFSQTFILDTIYSLANSTVSPEAARQLLPHTEKIAQSVRAIEHKAMQGIKKSAQPSLEWIKRIPLNVELSDSADRILTYFRHFLKELSGRAATTQRFRLFLQDLNIYDLSIKDATALIDNFEAYYYQNPTNPNVGLIINLLYELYPEVLSGYTFSVFGNSRDKVDMILFAQAGAYAGILKRIIMDLQSLALGQ